MAAVPMNTPMLPEAQNARDGKGGESADAADFGDALKQEIASCKPAAEKSTSDDTAAAETVSDAAPEDAGSEQTPAVLDPAVAALLYDLTLQQPATPDLPPHGAEAAPAAAQLPADAAATVQARTDDVASGDSRLVDAAPLQRQSLERARFDRMTERGAIEHAATAPDRLGRSSPEAREMRARSDVDDRLVQAREHSAAESTTTASFLAALGAERELAETPLQSASALPAQDSLSAAGLNARWGAPGTRGIGESAPAPATARVDTPLGTSGWGEAFQQKVVWMIDRHLEGAELHINPPHLGPVDVMLNLSADGAQIAFTSPHAAVREAIEASLPELRSALDERGLTLGQASVGADSGAAREQFAEQAREAAKNGQQGRAGGGSVALDSPKAAAPTIGRRGLVDTFA